MKRTLGTLALLFPAWASAAPVQLARESFEGPVGSIGYTTSYTYNDGTSVTPICAAVANNGTRIKGPRTISGGDGATMFAAVRVNRTSVAVGDNAPGPLTLTTNASSISGKINTSVRLLLSAPGDFVSSVTDLNVYDNSDPLNNFERILIEASIDGGVYAPLGQYSPTASVNSPLAYDADRNGVGGDPAPVGVPATLDATFKEAIFAIPTGNNVQVRLSFYSNGSAEYILFDDIRIFGETAATNPPAISGVPATTLNFTEGATAATIAPALTVTDTDSVTLLSATVTVSQNFTAGEDVLAATPSGGIVAGDITYAGGVLSINGMAPVTDYQAVLRSVTYRNSNLVNPSTATRLVTFATMDGSNPSNSPGREISVTDLVAVQPMPFTESFESDGRGTRYGVFGGFVSGNNLFARLNPTPDVPATDGIQVFAAEHTQTDSAPLEAVTFQVDTLGYASVKLDLLAATQGGAVFEQTDDFLLVQTSIDGGAWQTTGAFRAAGAVNQALALDADLNGSGEGAALTSSFQNFRFDMPVATTLGVRIVAATDGTGERILFDNIRLTGVQLPKFAIAAGSAAENSGNLNLAVTRSGNTAGAASVDYSLASGTATAGTDFTATGGTINFANGEVSKNVVVPIAADTTVELDETLTATLSNPGTGIIVTASGTGTIANDDSSVASLASGSVTEGDSGTAALGFTVSLTHPIDVAVTLDRQTLATGTAAAGSDFTALTTDSLTVPAGSTSASFTVAVAGDNLVEPDETVIASVSNLAANGRSLTLGTSSATGTIVDDDPLLIAGTGALSVKIGASGKLKTTNLLALTTIVEGRPVSLVSVQAAATPAGGSVTIVEGWIYYQPPAGYSGADSFTFTITDGVQTVNGTVNVVISAQAGETFNIYRLSDEGAGKRLLTLGIPGRTYQMQTSPDLSTWTPQGAAVICPAAGAMSFLDPGPLPPTRFYRVVEVTNPL